MGNYKYLACIGCGKLRSKTVRLNRGGRCVDCGIARALEFQRQMHAKAGPMYDEWLIAQQRAEARRAEGGVPPYPAAAG